MGVATAVAALTALLSVVAAPANAVHAPPKKAANSPYFYIGHAGGTQVQALGTTIRTDLSAASSVEGYTFPAHDDNRASGVNVGGGLVKIGTVTTWADAVPVANGTKTITGARTADLSLLGGVIKADAVETVTTATKTPDGVSSTSSTKFIGLTIAGQAYPVNLPKDFNITIPGVAAIVANSSTAYTLAGGSYITGFGLYVGLLKPFKDMPATATVLLNPTQSIVVPAPPPAAPTSVASATAPRSSRTPVRRSSWTADRARSSRRHLVAPRARPSRTPPPRSTCRTCCAWRRRSPGRRARPCPGTGRSRSTTSWQATTCSTG